MRLAPALKAVEVKVDEVVVDEVVVDEVAVDTAAVVDDDTNKRYSHKYIQNKT
jgi:hypothetical protein